MQDEKENNMIRAEFANLAYSILLLLAIRECKKEEEALIRLKLDCYIN